ncbi:MAG: DUF1553 domain-containing protein [Planctomycetes bacterium]|nr:DUF1553 domain-containing protein [Planctomycetota bacterium]NBY02119.1 DUF1553 domain-containing protein [Planctomycetota bacterium]
MCKKLMIAIFVLFFGGSFAGAQQVKVLPEVIELQGQGELHSVFVGLLQDGLVVADLSTVSNFVSSNLNVFTVDQKGKIKSVADGEALLRVKTKQGDATAKVTVKNALIPKKISFENEIIPALTRAGCNSGSCHGALAGKGGMKLSLRGYDPAADLFVLTRQANARRVDWVNPDSSLLLAKVSLKLPHGGGKKLPSDHPDYKLLSDWISQGTQPSSPTEPKLEAVEIIPSKLRLKSGDKLRMIAQARYSDGRLRDVSHWARFSSSEDQVAAVDQDGAVQVAGNGEASVIALFANHAGLGSIVSPFPNKLPADFLGKSPRNNFIDEFVLRKLQELQLPPSGQTTDSQFMRRLFLDMAGILPTEKELDDFVKDARPNKREALVDALLQRPETTDYWTYKWSDMLLISTRNLNQQAVWAFYQFVRKSIADNLPWDQFAQSLLTVKGSNLKKGAANYFVLHKDVTDLMETTAVTFMGMSLTCARCHNHPMEKWTQDQYWGMASMFARIGIKNGDAANEIIIETYPVGEVLHPRKGVAMPPTPLDAPAMKAGNSEDPRAVFSQWLTAKENPFFSRAIVNRVWRNFMGRGLIEAEDDLRVTNPASNPALLDALSEDFIKDGYDMKKLMRKIVLSAAYQRSSLPNPMNEMDDRFYSRFLPRRLKAEILLDACSEVTGVPTPFNQVLSRAGDAKTAYAGYPKGLRALQLPDASVASRFLDAFGRPERAQACSCERQQDSSVGQALHVFNGNTLNEKLRSKEFIGVQWIGENLSNSKIVERVFLRALSRKPNADELSRFMKIISDADPKDPKARQESIEDLVWAVLTSKEFVFNH